MASRVRPSWNIVVNRAPSEVFAYLADPRLHAEWSPKPYHVEGLDDAQVGVGTRFTSYGWIPGDGNHRNEVEVTEFEPPERITLRSEERDEFFVSTFSLVPEGGGTRITRTMDMPKPRGVLGVVFPLLVASLVKPQGQKGMRMLKERIEARSLTPPAQP